jgi:hypothetical protein
MPSKKKIDVTKKETVESKPPLNADAVDFKDAGQAENFMKNWAARGRTKLAGDLNEQYKAGVIDETGRRIRK